MGGPGAHYLADGREVVYFEVARGVVEVKLEPKDAGSHLLEGRRIVGGGPIIEAYIAGQASLGALRLASEGCGRDRGVAGVIGHIEQGGNAPRQGRSRAGR